MNFPLILQYKIKMVIYLDRRLDFVKIVFIKLVFPPILCPLRAFKLLYINALPGVV